MAYYFDFDSAHKILRSRFEGRIDDGEMRRHYRVAERYIALAAPRGGILDMSAVSAFEVSLVATIRELAHAEPVFSDPRLPRVLIAPAPSIFGLAQLFQLEGRDKRPNLHVVRSEEEALTVLGIPEASFTPMKLV